MLFADNPIGKSSYAITRHQLKDFICAGMDQFVIALKKEKAPRGHFVNVTDMLEQPFKDVLKSETIIEYPIFYIWLKSDGLPKEVITLEDKKQLIAVVKEDNKQESVELKEGPVEAKEVSVETKSADTEEAAQEEELVDTKEGSLDIKQDVSSQSTIGVDINSKVVNDTPLQETEQPTVDDDTS